MQDNLILTQNLLTYFEEQLKLIEADLLALRIDPLNFNGYLLDHSALVGRRDLILEVLENHSVSLTQAVTNQS